MQVIWGRRQEEIRKIGNFVRALGWTSRLALWQPDRFVKLSGPVARQAHNPVPTTSHQALEKNRFRGRLLAIFGRRFHSGSAVEAAGGKPQREIEGAGCNATIQL
jgi:hypothetical protein